MADRSLKYTTSFIFQINLLDSLGSIIQNPVRNRSRLIDADGDCAWGNVLDYLDIHQFALRIGFSLSEGDDMRTIRATIENSTRNSNKVESVQIPYPTGLLDISNIQLATGFFINPMFIWLNISYIALGI